MANLKKVLKLTQSQYDILASGGTVGSYTGLDDRYLYLVEDTNTYITSEGGVITGSLTIEGNLELEDITTMPYGSGINFVDSNGHIVASIAADNTGDDELIYLAPDGEERPLLATDNGRIIYSEADDYSSTITVQTQQLIIQDGNADNIIGISPEDHRISTETEDYYLPENGGTLATTDDIPSEILDTNVILETDLKTYYNIGKIDNASGTNPVIVGHAGDSLRDVFNNIMNMDEEQPTATQPSITSLIISTTTALNNWDEEGTRITQVSYNITKNQGSYTYDSSTGVAWTNFNFTGGCNSTNVGTSTTGTLTLKNTYKVGTSFAVSFICTGTHSAGNIAKTNLGNNSNPIVQIQAGTKTRNASFSVTSKNYPYFTNTLTTDAPTTGTRDKADKLRSTSGTNQANYVNQNYFWVIVPENTYSRIQIWSNLAQEWSDMLGGTEPPVTVNFTLASGITKTYYAYRTLNVAQSSSTDETLIRII